jgi:hypothetical protein
MSVYMSFNHNSMNCPKYAGTKATQSITVIHKQAAANIRMKSLQERILEYR